VRAHAIPYLGSEASVEDLNVLADLARYGEDHVVRGHALIAIGVSGVRLAEALLVQGLDASHAFEQAAAEKGLLALGHRLGMSAVRGALADDRFHAVRQRLEERLAGGTRRGRSPRRSTTAPEPKALHLIYRPECERPSLCNQLHESLPLARTITFNYRQPCHSGRPLDVVPESVARFESHPLPPTKMSFQLQR
jgi:hypothetical protein